MTNLSHIALRFLALLIGIAAEALPCTADYYSYNNGNNFGICRRWPQNRLVIGDDLQARRLTLEEAPGAHLERLPGLVGVISRKVFHKAYVLSLDVPESISVFETRVPKSLVLARDRTQKLPLSVPVFFVGRPGESRDELSDNAKSVAFAPSAPMDSGMSFVDVSFHLRHGGAWFDEIRPFFCGLPGLLVCEQSCPGDFARLAASFVNEVLSGRRDAIISAGGEERARRGGGQAVSESAGQGEEEKPAPSVSKPETKEAAPKQEENKAPAPATRGEAPSPAAANAPERPGTSAAPQAPQPEMQPRQQETMPARGEAPAQRPAAPTPAVPTKRLVFTFQREDGRAPWGPPSDVLESRGRPQH